MLQKHSLNSYVIIYFLTRRNFNVCTSVQFHSGFALIFELSHNCIISTFSASGMYSNVACSSKKSASVDMHYEGHCMNVKLY